MREAVRYLSEDKLALFIKIPYLLHINSLRYPGYINDDNCPHGIVNFEQSGFYKLAVKDGIFPKSITQGYKVKNPYILGLYHIGSLGTFTQSSGSDFDYWVIIDKKKFTQKSYTLMEKKLDAIVKFSRESCGQQVTFFIMDAKEIKNDCYAPFEGEETLIVPRIFLKEEFYRTYLMIAGKIPLWSILPHEGIDKPVLQRMTSQILNSHEDLIDLGMVSQPPFNDILKGLLWHICKSTEDPVKALIKATLVFSYGFGNKEHSSLLCNEIKQEYSGAGMDDYSKDPYKIVFDRILDFHEKNDPDRVHLIKNAVFFRLCGFPNVELPKEEAPKRQLLNSYIRKWSLKKSQVTKLLSYCTWAESEKLLLEKAILNRMAQMYNLAIKQDQNGLVEIDPVEKRNWHILKNKTRQRLRTPDNKINRCSTFLRKRKIYNLIFQQAKAGWRILTKSKTQKEFEVLYRNPALSGVLGWVFANNLYNRYRVPLYFKSQYKIFEVSPDPIEPDHIYMAFQPIQVLFEETFGRDPEWMKQAVFLYFKKDVPNRILEKAEILVSNSWGELFHDLVAFQGDMTLPEQLEVLSKKMEIYFSKETRLLVYQVSTDFDPDISFELKKTFEDVTAKSTRPERLEDKPYLDRI